MKILVPVDGSQQAAEGLKVVSALADNRPATVFVMTIVPSVADIDLELTASERDRLLESMKRRAEDLLERSTGPLRTACRGTVNAVLAIGDSPAQEIIAFAEREKIDIVVIGSRGRNGSGRFQLGSVAARVVRHSPCCVYVVKEPCWV
ncbi:MAG: universal stress protein [Nitrospiraceae bacterium]|nr:universal stress protein [Nitrospiraceae bacterium]